MNVYFVRGAELDCICMLAKNHFLFVGCKMVSVSLKDQSVVLYAVCGLLCVHQILQTDLFSLFGSSLCCILWALCALSCLYQMLHTEKYVEFKFWSALFGYCKLRYAFIRCTCERNDLSRCYTMIGLLRTIIVFFSDAVPGSSCWIRCLSVIGLLSNDQCAVSGSCSSIIILQSDAA